MMPAEARDKSVGGDPKLAEMFVQVIYGLDGQCVEYIQLNM